MERDSKQFTTRRGTQTSLRRSLPLECQTVSRYTRTCKLIYQNMKITVFSAPM